MHEATTGEGVCYEMGNLRKQSKLQLSKLTCIVTEGDPSIRVLNRRYRKNNEKPGSNTQLFYCKIYPEAFRGKVIRMEHILTRVVSIDMLMRVAKIISSIVFSFSFDIESKYEDLHNTQKFGDILPF